MAGINRKDRDALNDLLTEMGTIRQATNRGYKGHHRQAADLLRRIQQQVSSNATLDNALEQLDADDFLEGGYKALIGLLSQVRGSL